MKKSCAPSWWVTAQKVNRKLSIYLFDDDMVNTEKNCGIKAVERFQTKFKVF